MINGFGDKERTDKEQIGIEKLREVFYTHLFEDGTKLNISFEIIPPLKAKKKLQSASFLSQMSICTHLQL